MTKINQELFAQLTEEVPAITAATVISKRQIEIATQINEVELELMALAERLEALKIRRAELLMEHDILEKFDDRGMVRLTTTTTTTTLEVGGRKKAQDRIGFEDSLKAVMREAGRPLQFADIRNRLESYGYIWSNYNTAYSYITRLCGLLEQASRGFYQLKR